MTQPLTTSACCRWFVSQGARTLTNIERLFQELDAKYPNLDPAEFVKELGQLLESLVTNTLDLTSRFAVATADSQLLSVRSQ